MGLSLEKARSLLKEAELDLKAKCYNKAASAAYFAARMTADCLLEARGLQVPRRDDKLANLVEHLGLREAASLLRDLYNTRKRADYSSLEVAGEEAAEALEKAKRAMELLKALT